MVVVRGTSSWRPFICGDEKRKEFLIGLRHGARPEDSARSCQGRFGSAVDCMRQPRPENRVLLLVAEED